MMHKDRVMKLTWIKTALEEYKASRHHHLALLANNLAPKKYDVRHLGGIWGLAKPEDHISLLNNLHFLC